MQTHFNRIFTVSLAALSLGLTSPVLAQSATATDVTIAGVEIKMDPAIVELLPEKYQNSGLRVEVDPPYAPFLMIDESGDFYGADISMTNAVAARLGIPVTYGRVRWDASIPALQAGSYDLLIGMGADTVERQEVVNGISYTNYGISLVVQGGNPDGIASGADLCGKRLVIIAGWSPVDYFDGLTESCVARGLPAVNKSVLPGTADTLIAVQSGAADATYISTPVVIAATKDVEGAGVTIVTPEDTPGGWNPQNHGWATLKEEEALTTALAAALDSLLADGTAKRIFDEYSVGDLLLDKTAVNEALPNVDLE